MDSIDEMSDSIIGMGTNIDHYHRSDGNTKKVEINETTSISSTHVQQALSDKKNDDDSNKVSLFRFLMETFSAVLGFNILGHDNAMEVVDKEIKVNIAKLWRWY